MSNLIKRFSEYPTGILPVSSPDVIVFWSDFAERDWPLTSNEPVTASGPWIGTALASGTTAFTDAIGGTVILSGAATTDNSGSQIQHDLGLWALQASKDIAFYVRFKLSNATDSHFYAGVGTTDTTFIDGGDADAALVHTDSFGIWKPDDAAIPYFTVNNATTITKPFAFPALSDNTYVELEFLYQASATAGSGVVKCYTNRTLVGQGSVSGGPTTTLALVLAQVSGTATGTVSATIDAVGIMMER